MIDQDRLGERDRESAVTNPLSSLPKVLLEHQTQPPRPPSLTLSQPLPSFPIAPVCGFLHPWLSFSVRSVFVASPRHPPKREEAGDRILTRIYVLETVSMHIYFSDPKPKKEGLGGSGLGVSLSIQAGGVLYAS